MANDTVELFYRYFETTPVTSNYRCVVIVATVQDPSSPRNVLHGLNQAR